MESDDATVPLLGQVDNESVNGDRLDGKKATFRQVVASLGAATGALSMGCCLGWASPAIAQLTNSTSGPPGPLDTSQASWVGSLVCLGALVQVPLTGPLMEKVGRRLALLLTCVPLLAGWILVITGRVVWVLYLGRLLTGYSAASYSVLVPVYISEIATPRLRGALGTMFQLLVVTGILAMYVLGVVLRWDWLACVGLVPVSLTVVCMIFLPDTPSYLVKAGKTEKAIEALRWFRDKQDVSGEIEELGSGNEEHSNDESESVVSMLRDPAVYKPVLLIIVIMVINQMSGINVIITYTVSIFLEAGVSIPAEWAGVIVGAIQVVGTTSSVFLIKSVNRRPVLVTSLVFMGAALGSFGTYFYTSPGQNYGWIPVTCLVVFILAFSLGQGPLAWVLLGDLATPRAAPLAGAAASATNWGVAFATTVSYDSLEAAIGQAGTYWLYSGCCLAGAFFVTLAVPETRGRSLQDIQRIFSRSDRTLL